MLVKNEMVVKDTGEQVGFHIIDKDSLENYLFENIKFDTPSTTRHRFGSLILENDGKVYFFYKVKTTVFQTVGFSYEIKWLFLC